MLVLTPLMSDLTVNPRARSIYYDGNKGAVLLLHGLTGSPYTFGPLARRLADEGYEAAAPLLPGHGTSPEHLHYLGGATGWSLRAGLLTVWLTAKNVFIVGFSMGSLLATVVAQERGLKVAGLVAIAVPLELDLKSQTVLKIARKVPIDLVVPFVKKDNGPDVSDPGVAAAMPSYDRTPIAAAVSMLEGQALAADRASRLAVPVLVLHGRHDHVAPVRNARVFYDLLQTPSRRLIIYPKSWHILPLDIEHEQMQADVVDFVNPKDWG